MSKSKIRNYKNKLNNEKFEIQKDIRKKFEIYMFNLKQNRLIFQLLILQRKLFRYAKHIHGNDILKEVEVEELKSSMEKIIKNIIKINFEISGSNIEYLFDKEKRNFLLEAYDEFIKELNRYNLVGNLVIDFVDSIRKLNWKVEK